jgi:hypothetical protein
MRRPPSLALALCCSSVISAGAVCEVQIGPEIFSVTARVILESYTAGPKAILHRFASSGFRHKAAGQPLSSKRAQEVVVHDLREDPVAQARRAWPASPALATCNTRERSRKPLLVSSASWACGVGSHQPPCRSWTPITGVRTGLTEVAVNP